MIKGPLVWSVLILAVLLMILSAIMVLDRDFFLENSTVITIVSGIIAAAVVIVMILMLIRTRKAVK
jgi:NADH:ubiquinone oxidoreductase subunit 6 (subunit J)